MIGVGEVLDSILKSPFGSWSNIYPKLTALVDVPEGMDPCYVLRSSEEHIEQVVKVGTICNAGE